jgi:Tol biopolymer transport system component
MRRLRTVPLLLALSLLVACGDDEGNPFAQFSLSRSPGEDAVAIFVSGSWAETTGGPRELFAVNADGTVDRLTTCTQTEVPCDFIEVAPSSDRNRVMAVRGAVEGDPLASALYFMDLDRSVETIIATARRVQSADWAIDDSFVVYSSGDVENLFLVRPNGDEDGALTDSEDLRERNPRIDPSISFVAYEGLFETPGKSGIYLYLGGNNAASPLTEGGPGTEPLGGTPYIVGSDASPAFSPNGQLVAFRRLTGTGNGGLGSWDLYYVAVNEEDPEPVFVDGGDGLYRGRPDWGLDARLLFVETDVAAGVSRLVAVYGDGSEREVLYSEDAAFGMQSPRWLRPLAQ